MAPASLRWQPCCALIRWPSCAAIACCLLLSQLGASYAASVFVVHMAGPHSPLAAFPDAFDSQGNMDASSQRSQAYSSFLASLHDSVLEESLEAGSYEKLYSYTTILNAFAVKLSHQRVQVGALQDHPRVSKVEPDARFEKATTYTPEFLGLPDGAWRWRSRPPSAAAAAQVDAGEGVTVGVLDTGIDPSHPSFSGLGFKPPGRRWRGKCHISPTFPRGSCNGKIVAARHYSKGIVAASAFNATYDFDSPLDGDGHGTHTSSIAVGNYGVPVIVSGYNYGLASGMAPRARLAVYKVIYRDGGYLSDVLAGVDQAIQDGVNVLSISLGSTTSALGVPFLSTFDIALLFATKAGALVVHAAGNSGPAPMTMNSFGPWLLSVGSASTDRVYVDPVILENQQEFLGIGLSGGTPEGKIYPLIYSKDAYVDQSITTFDPEYYSYCPDAHPFNRTLVEGKILICNFMQLFTGGVGTQIQDALNTAKNLSAVGLLIITPDSDFTQEKPVVLDPSPYSLPATFITDIDSSLIILAYYNAKTERDLSKKVISFGASAWIKDSRVPEFMSEAPEVAYYSSRGPVYANTATSMQSDVLKPDILAPGSQIWGAWTPAGIDTNGYKGEHFAMVSGTSMAAPHIAGIAAILRQKHPKWSNAAIRSALLTTASLMDNKHRFLVAHQPSLNISLPVGLASPFDCGSGFVNATSALDPGLVFDVGFQDYVNFLCTVPGADANSVEEATGAVCHKQVGERSSDLNLPSITVGNLIGSRKVTRQVTSVFRRKERYTVQVHQPAGVDVYVEPKTFTVGKGETRRFTVTLRAVGTNQAFTFGSLVWTGSKGHLVRMPVAVSAAFISA